MIGGKLTDSCQISVNDACTIETRDIGSHLWMQTREGAQAMHQVQHHLPHASVAGDDDDVDCGQDFWVVGTGQWPV